MFLNNSVNLFLLGLAIGGSVAVLGGLAEYVLHLRRDQSPFTGVPSCLLYTIGGLALAGVVALGASLVFTGGLVPALYVGAGVLAGFYGGFIIMVSLWLLIDRLRSPEAPMPPEASVPPDTLSQ